VSARDASSVWRAALRHAHEVVDVERIRLLSIRAVDLERRFGRQACGLAVERGQLEMHARASAFVPLLLELRERAVEIAV
jgi:hypothetical protein